jgi:hypothetical protein
VAIIVVLLTENMMFWIRQSCDSKHGSTGTRTIPYFSIYFSFFLRSPMRIRNYQICDPSVTPLNYAQNKIQLVTFNILSIFRGWDSRTKKSLKLARPRSVTTQAGEGTRRSRKREWEDPTPEG